MVLFLRYNNHFNFREIAESFGEPLHTIIRQFRRKRHRPINSIKINKSQSIELNHRDIPKIFRKIQSEMPNQKGETRSIRLF
ncbi:MAG: hypothetical protein A3D52_02260 [Candidatus Taylorbacteria bacterium RIFCSPHIGHO2_02_FULL_44_36]|uniref:Uncharacterized protein n=1 Tax=Candidatus Taylorbacteria bacterium RIFCSPLOWO2_12_FULL_44_15c TaxID=1802333 RepID=A0A1G2P7S8_9BACT|nr:MAG: hypothetical protein A3D52_02260 [Candidatus Taylorbacteria bacterium RIFCSPHIGHO2_02_FULL_44_36]OHA38212.1 MAG: hypothetical protein A3I97_02150 [Candidatus Taylorbacteria bacterium RIFCSPLOWO2_02_FULL_44_35]OHA44406.1 MAG: hypothetical protein A3G03_01585 [Candidatus Taylorbacteria bacterium RIFCSPLOWO2_12_FULL_44_15c]